MDKKATEKYGFDWLRKWMMRCFWVFMYFYVGLVFSFEETASNDCGCCYRNHRIIFSGNESAKMYHVNV